MKQKNQKIRQLIKALNEEVSKNARVLNYQELEKKTTELRNLLLQQKASGAKQVQGDLFSGTIKQEDPIYPISHLVNDSIKRLEARARDRSDRYFITTGFDGLDRLIGGWEPGELVVIGARPGMGKTSLVLSMMKNITRKSDVPIGYLSLEVPVSHLMERIISSEAEVPLTRLKKLRLKEDDWNRIIDGSGDIKKRKIFIVDNPHFSVESIKDAAERLVSEHGVRLIIIDYLQLIGSIPTKRNREQMVSSVIREIKMLAKRLRLVIILTSQLNRMVELRSGYKRPYLADLRDSGAIEEDTDKVIFIHRPEMYDILEDEQGNSLVGVAELIVAKNRTGPAGEIRLHFTKEFGKFYEMKADPKAYRNISQWDISEEDLLY